MAVDAGWAGWFPWQLEDAGHRVLIQKWDFVPGSNSRFRLQGRLLSADGRGGGRPVGGQPLFSDDELDVARGRLWQYGFHIDA
ncbi:toll/interleukin-1 receptor domain-containing protein [Parafrankia sp. EUN1f]|uniref:toll/interleukin-1 receptor domain-containing protein n=1 Tax=Parafrankia sp. EUN1f TaxID=102897 RepID=UPI001E30442C|nr:toll/interleukin-1 receptor domain-containing protein [Parafrankia sp. EUN1f]